jgi:hypothetical protein
MRRWLSGAGTGDALGESVGAEQETALGAVDITTFSPGVSGDSRHVGGSGSGSGRRTDHEFFKDRLEPGSVQGGAHGTDEKRPGIRQASQA